MTDLQRLQHQIADAHATAAWASGVRWTCRCIEGCGPAAARWYEPENLGSPDNILLRPRRSVTQEEGRFD